MASWTPDARTTTAFARYGNNNTRTDDWTGGDGTHAVRLPDGRVLWLFSDSFLGAVHRPPNRRGQPYAWRDKSAPFVRNSGVVAGRDGSPVRTLRAPLFPDPAPAQWRWPVSARVEGRTVRVLLWRRAASGPPLVFGRPLATEVATLSLPGLRVESVRTIAKGPVLYGTSAVDAGGWTYAFGTDDTVTPSSAYAAHARRGHLGDPAEWRYWDGAGWDRRPGHAKPVLRGGVGSAFTVARSGRTWVLVTPAAGLAGLGRFVTYWSCSATGPWHGPGRGFNPPLPRDSSPRPATVAYNPQLHTALTGGPVLSYDVNWLTADPDEALAAVDRNVSLYRPRFLRLRWGP